MTGTGLRERKKLETHRRLAGAALELASERGPDGFTVEDIAAAADVSVRTFFNYFSCRDEAIVGYDPDALRDLADQLRGRPPGEAPAAALRQVLLGGDDPEAVLCRWQQRTELVHLHPALHSRFLGSIAEVEWTLGEALAERMGLDPKTSPSPSVIVATVLAAIRSSISWWVGSDRSTTLLVTVEQALDRLASDIGAGTGRKPT